MQKHRVRSRNHHPYMDNDQVTRPRRPYQIHCQSPELFAGKNERLVLNSSVWRTVAKTNKFEVSSKAKLLPKEIAGIVVGSIAGGSAAGRPVRTRSENCKEEEHGSCGSAEAGRWRPQRREGGFSLSCVVIVTRDCLLGLRIPMLEESRVLQTQISASLYCQSISNHGRYPY